MHFAVKRLEPINQPIANFSAFPLYAQARHQLRAETWGAIEDRRSLAFDTATTFLNTLASERLLEAAQRRLDRAIATQKDAQARVDAELASTNDATRASIDTTTAQSQVAQARGNLDRAYLELSFLVGRSVTGPLVTPERTTRAAKATPTTADSLANPENTNSPPPASSSRATAHIKGAPSAIGSAEARPRISRTFPSRTRFLLGC